MKRKFLILTLSLALGAGAGRAETNNLTSLLQQGLLEEEATHDLNGAISNYQSIAAQFDSGRQLAATAIYRLGECYRKLNRTNEALAQYSRIVREFSDQQTLATLSQQNIEGMGGSRQSGVTGAGAGGVAPDNLRTQYALLKAQLDHARSETNDELVADIFHDQPYADSLRNVLGNRQGRPAGSPDAYNLDRLVKEFRRKLLDYEEMRLKIVQSAIEQGGGLQTAQVSTEGQATRAIGEEDTEIQRIERMIQNSPDLVNNGNLLYDAAQNGRLRVATFLLDHGVDVNGHNGGVPLIAAAAAAEKAMVELLLSRGADINARGGTGGTALHRAVEGGYLAVVDLLLAHKPDLNARNSDINGGNTALHIAVQKGYENLVKVLLGAGADPNVENARGITPLSYAAQDGSFELEKMMLAAKADPNGGKLDAPLLAAVHRSDAASAELLLQAGADPNADGMVEWRVNGWRTQSPNFAKVTPLFLAVSTGQLPMTQLLLKNKADPNIPAQNGDPLVFSALTDAGVLGALLDAGAQVEAPGQSGYSNRGKLVHWTPLDAAARCKYAEAVEVLLKHGANPNASNESGETPLYLAAQGPSDAKIFELLLDAKADPNVRDDSGRTPLDVLKQRFGRRPPGSIRPDDQPELAMALVDVLHQYGALDNLPNWDRIEVLPDSTHNAETIFLKDTNDWNRFTLVQTIFDYFVPGRMQSTPGGVSAAVFVQREGGTAIPRPTENAMPFPDLAHVVILRPRHGSTNTTKIAINLLDANNAIECSKDVPLEFGDVVEIPQRDHPLGAAPWWVNDNQVSAMINYLHGTAHLVARDQKAELPLDPWGDQSLVGSALHQSAAQQILLASSDLAHVKVTRHDAKTGQEREWIVDCSGSQSPGLVLRDGDVVTVPEKP